LINAFECFHARAAEALAADGADREIIMKLFIDHALEVLDKTPGIPMIPPCGPLCVFTAFLTAPRKHPDERRG
jgi:hypothetical protein